MIPRVLQRRSSWPSSYAIGLIGWVGFLVLVDLALGYRTPVGTLALAGALAAVAQVTLLRLGFSTLGLDRGVRRGGLWGGLSGGWSMIPLVQLFPVLGHHPVVWVLDGAYIGAAVGLFLAYFYRDDRAIEAEAAAGGAAVDYGRDAHWLEPFIFGAAAYLVVFLPRSLDLALAALVVGAMGGVVAAGVSHFFLLADLAGWRGAALPLLAGLAAGLAQGATSGLLFWQWVDQLPVSPLLLGTLAGAATYLLTTLRGRVLARQERVEG